MKRVFLIVLDSLGIGALPDSLQFGDKDVNTLRAISKSKYFYIPNLIKLGLGNIDTVSCLQKTTDFTGTVARLEELSRGKDTTIGHWEIAGVVSDRPLPTYPDGFPREVIKEFEEKTHKKVICNLPFSGTQVIKEYGEQHLKSGNLIVYTSADSVFQIAAHEKIVPVEELYEYCLIARNILQGEHAVGRVIARPFTGGFPDFTRTENRKDFSVEAPQKTVLDALLSEGYDVISVGKISDIFAGRGITQSIHTHNNKEGMEAAISLSKKDFNGLAFINLVDFDMLYGHRNDANGYAKALSEFDEWLPSFINNLNEDDILIITADHGCDPSDISTDHTREYVPMIIYNKNISGKNLGTIKSFTCIAATIANLFDVSYDTYAEPIIL